MKILELINNKQKSFFFDMIKYSIVSVIALIVDFGILITLNKFGVYYLTAASISFILATIVSYKLSHGKIFRQPVIRSKLLHFLAVVFVALIGLTFNNLILWFFVSHENFNLITSKLLATIIVFFWNFTARRQLLYEGHKKRRLRI